VFPNSRKTGPIWHEDLLSRRIQPVGGRAWPSAHHVASSQALGATQMVEARMPLKQRRNAWGTRDPIFFSRFYAHASTRRRTWRRRRLVVSSGADLSFRWLPMQLINLGLYANCPPYWRPRAEAGFISSSKLLRRLWRRGSGSNRRIKVLQFSQFHLTS